MKLVRKWGLALMAYVIWTGLVLAQSAEDIVWLQIEAHPSLTVATERAQLYAGRVEDVNGFSLDGGWFGIALGPYRRADAEQVLQVYRADGLIPRDSYLALSPSYRQQFWPVGANILNRGVLNAPVGQSNTDVVAQTPTPEVTLQTSDETPAQARRSEQQLSRSERQDLQIALQWAGFYSAAIDGAFGRGTRRSMGNWQEANNFEVTGILTTAQRAALFAQYNAVLNGLDLRLTRDVNAGIEMLIPTGIVAFDDYEYPFARYAATGDIGAQVLLISQEGDTNTLSGLYDIMQTLEIVPLDGNREKRPASFLLIGENDRMISHTEAELRNGQIKGFSLIWPAGDEDRRTRVLTEMRASFQRTEGVLDPSWGDGADQAVDLVSGLQIRTPRLSRSGFFVDNAGAVVTTLEAVQSCTRITVDQDTDMRLAAANDSLGVAILTPETALSPRAVAQFSGTVPRLQSDVAVAGFSYEGVLGAPTMTFGTLSELTGLRGETDLSRLQLELFDGDAGGPVFAHTGGVLGMALPRTASSRQLPADVTFAANADSIQSLLQQTGIRPSTQNTRASKAPEDITQDARAMTVLVSCWD